jgi:hypothetical protein
MLFRKCRYVARATASVTDNNSVQNLSQTRIDGTENSLNTKTTAMVLFRLDYFDGLRMFARKEQLRIAKNWVLELQLTTY